MTDPNEDLTLAARGLCKQRNNRAHMAAQLIAVSGMVF